MKYIRTKDKIITNDNVKEIDQAYFNDEKMTQADTIEELCDSKVIVDKNGGYHLVVTNPESLSIISQNEIVYGAIWTDKGLIYVAKMNEKGELELL